MTDRHTKALTRWAKQWKEENLTEEVRSRISQATTDLYDGTVIDDDYPGFITATKEITQALQALPFDVYIDLDTDDVSETEPQAEECEACDGFGNMIEDEDTVCDICNGQKYHSGGEWYHVERAEIKAAIVGKELAVYV